MADKVVALFVEGPTEIEFYKAVIAEARRVMRTPFPCEIEYIDMKGIGNYKKDALRKFNKLKKDPYRFCADSKYILIRMARILFTKKS